MRGTVRCKMPSQRNATTHLRLMQSDAGAKRASLSQVGRQTGPWDIGSQPIRPECSVYSSMKLLIAARSSQRIQGSALANSRGWSWGAATAAAQWRLSGRVPAQTAQSNNIRVEMGTIDDGRYCRVVVSWWRSGLMRRAVSCCRRAVNWR
jgi:hypothetical protein